MEIQTFNVIKIFILASLSCFVALLWTPLLTNFLYKHKLWKKFSGKRALSGEEAVVFNQLHKDKEVGTPRMGGILIWVTVLIIIYFFYFLSLIFPNSWISEFNFLSRSQTWLPLFALVAASLLGFFDDLFQVLAKGKYTGGISLKKRIIVVSLIGLIGGWWFYYKLNWDIVYIPFLGNISIGWLFVPFFILVTLACWAGGIVDGLDGLAGGVFASIFGALTIISFSIGKVDLAAFCAVILGSLFTFLWFNIPPARFYMSETGTLGLTVTLSVVSFLTNSVYVLPIIGGILVIEVLSVIIQLLSKKFRKKKVFLSTPIHHHFEALGWPSYKVTMRFWIVGAVLAFLGVAIRLLF